MENKKSFYIDDTMWWYSVIGKYETDKIIKILQEANIKNIYTTQKYGWSNMPEVVCFVIKKPNDLIGLDNRFKKEFGDYYSFSLRTKDWNTKTEKK